MEVTSPSVTSSRLPFVSPQDPLHGYLQPPPREGGICHIAGAMRTWGEA